MSDLKKYDLDCDLGVLMDSDDTYIFDRGGDWGIDNLSPSYKFVKNISNEIVNVELKGVSYRIPPHKKMSLSDFTYSNQDKGADDGQ